MSIWDKIKGIFSAEDRPENPKNSVNPDQEESPLEVTKGGSVVYKYDEVEEDPSHLFPEVTCVYLEEIEDHLSKYIGDTDMVFHEIISEHVHIDVHWIKPSADYPYHILVTSGMSDKPMHIPAEVENPYDYERAELMVVLPSTWEIGDEEFKDNNNYWPVYFLKMLARFPHQYRTWLGYGHTIPNGAEADAIANTGFGCMLVLPPMVSFDEEFLALETKDGNLINFYVLIPLYKEEMDFKLEYGTEALMEKFDESGITELIDINRPNVCG